MTQPADKPWQVMKIFLKPQRAETEGSRIEIAAH